MPGFISVLSVCDYIHSVIGFQDPLNWGFWLSKLTMSCLWDMQNMKKEKIVRTKWDMWQERINDAVDEYSNRNIDRIKSDIESIGDEIQEEIDALEQAKSCVEDMVYAMEDNREVDDADLKQYDPQA